MHTTAQRETIFRRNTTVDPTSRLIVKIHSIKTILIFTNYKLQGRNVTVIFKMDGSLVTDHEKKLHKCEATVQVRNQPELSQEGKESPLCKKMITTYFGAFRDPCAKDIPRKTLGCWYGFASTTCTSNEVHSHIPFHYLIWCHSHSPP